MSLYQSLAKPDRQKTMLAYRVKHWPLSELSQAARERIISNRVIYLPKRQILESCNDPLTELRWKAYDYTIAWAWNNIPTEQEWDKKSDSYLIRVELRWSPLIAGGNVALLSFELPSSLDLNQLNQARQEQSA